MARVSVAQDVTAVESAEGSSVTAGVHDLWQTFYTMRQAVVMLGL